MYKVIKNFIAFYKEAQEARDRQEQIAQQKAWFEEYSEAVSKEPKLPPVFSAAARKFGQRPPMILMYDRRPMYGPLYDYHKFD